MGKKWRNKKKPQNGNSGKMDEVCTTLLSVSYHYCCSNVECNAHESWAWVMMVQHLSILYAYCIVLFKPRNDCYPVFFMAMAIE